MIPYSRQVIEDDDIEAVARVLRGDWLTTGPAVEEFEGALAEYVGAEHAVAVSNGTAALHAALWAAEVGPGDVVATSPLSFSASANCARYVGAEVSFADIDPATLNLDATTLPACDALVAVHYAGLPVDLSQIRRRPRVVIEDAAQALGARSADGPVGNCARSDMTTFSFHPVKSITTGEGGAITTNDPHLASRLRTFRSHGIVPTPEDGGWTYDIPELGYNYRLTDFQAALGTSQLQKLDRFIDDRNRLAARYRRLLGDDERILLPPEAPSGWRHAYHLFAVRVPHRREVYDRLRSRGIGVQVHHVPIYRLSAYGSEPLCWPATEAAYASLISLPLYPTLTDVEQDRVLAELDAALA